MSESSVEVLSGEWVCCGASDWPLRIGSYSIFVRFGDFVIFNIPIWVVGRQVYHYKLCSEAFLPTLYVR